MTPIRFDRISNRLIEPRRTHPAHMAGGTGVNGTARGAAPSASGAPPPGASPPGASPAEPPPVRADRFGTMIAQAVGRVSDGQLSADALFERMLTHPDEVEPHDVSIAMARAEMSLNLTKSVVDRAVKAYTDITTMR